MPSRLPLVVVVWVASLTRLPSTLFRVSSSVVCRCASAWRRGTAVPAVLRRASSMFHSMCMMIESVIRSQGNGRASSCSAQPQRRLLNEVERIQAKYKRAQGTPRRTPASVGVSLAISLAKRIFFSPVERGRYSPERPSIGFAQWACLPCRRCPLCAVPFFSLFIK